MAVPHKQYQKGKVHRASYRGHLYSLLLSGPPRRASSQWQALFFVPYHRHFPCLFLKRSWLPVHWQSDEVLFSLLPEFPAVHSESALNICCKLPLQQPPHRSHWSKYCFSCHSLPPFLKNNSFYTKYPLYLQFR